jgi:hypothetical protein
MAKRIAWTDKARADMRAIDRETAMGLLHGLSRFITTEQGDLKQLRGTDPPELRFGSAITGYDSTITVTSSRS